MDTATALKELQEHIFKELSSDFQNEVLEFEQSLCTLMAASNATYHSAQTLLRAIKKRNVDDSTDNERQHKRSRTSSNNDDYVIDTSNEELFSIEECNDNDDDNEDELQMFNVMYQHNNSEKLLFQLQKHNDFIFKLIAKRKFNVGDIVGVMHGESVSSSRLNRELRDVNSYRYFNRELNSWIKCRSVFDNKIGCPLGLSRHAIEDEIENANVDIDYYGTGFARKEINIDDEILTLRHDI